MKLIFVFIISCVCFTVNGQSKSFGRLVSFPLTTTFSFIWDDVQTSDSTAARIGRNYGFLQNYALKTNQLTASNTIFYLNQWRNGSTLLAHSETHTNIYNNPATPYDSIRQQMLRSLNAINAFLGGSFVKGWVTPQSVLNSIFYPLSDSIFTYAFVSLGQDFSRTISKGRLSRISMEGTSLDSLKMYVDLAISNKLMINFYAHHLPSTLGNEFLDETKLRAFFAYIKTKVDLFQCRVLSTDEAIRQYYLP